MINRKESYYLVLIIVVASFFLGGCEKKKPEHRLQWHIDSLYSEDVSDDVKVKVAIIDSGVDSSHPDIKIKKQICLSSINNDKNDNNEHGTEVAGIISAYPHDKKGALGINPNAEIYSIDVMDESENADVNQLIEAINLAVNEKADIINISMGVEKGTSELHKCIKKAYEKGIIIVAAAGNDYDEKILYPAKYKEVLCVGSIDRQKNIIYKEKAECDVYAPGKNIVTTSPVKGVEMYVGVNGTSMSTPIVSGVISKIIEKYPQISNNLIYDEMRQIKYITSMEEIYKKFEA